MFNITEEESDDEFEEPYLSLTLPSDQTTVIDKEATVIETKIEPVSIQSILNTEYAGEPAKSHHLVQYPTVNVEGEWIEDNLPDKEKLANYNERFIQSERYIRFIGEVRNYYGREVNQFGT